jgi:hypothetical protein
VDPRRDGGGDGLAEGWSAVVPDTLRRWLYRQRRAGGLARVLNAAQAGLAAAGVGAREPVLLQEVDAGRRAPILRSYLRRAPGARAHIPVDYRAPVEAFEPIAAQYPVFRITAAQKAAR